MNITMNTIEKNTRTARNQSEYGIQYLEWMPDPAPRLDLLALGVAIGVMVFFAISDFI